MQMRFLILGIALAGLVIGGLIWMRSQQSKPDPVPQQVTAPVRFTEMVTRLRALGVEQFLEVGPGRVLSGLIARIERRSQRAGLSTLGDLEAAQLFVDGEQPGQPV